ncbi:nickel-type superoxide dismutase maturation protease [Actinomadura sp. J1-007]|nr:nickel-type superoxide dismutase maturation protease [Actinomadura sp. J1-007]
MRGRTAALLVIGAAAGGHALVRRLRAVEVEGASMLPALRPGDWLLVLNGARVAPGDLVVARHPRRDGLLVVKRAAHREAGGWWLESDNQGAPGRQDSWDFGAVPDGLVEGRVVARYWPFGRFALLAPPRPLSSGSPSGRGRSSSAETRGWGGWLAAATLGRPAQRSEQ